MIRSIRITRHQLPAPCPVQQTRANGVTVTIHATTVSIVDSPPCGSERRSLVALVKGPQILGNGKFASFTALLWNVNALADVELLPTSVRRIVQAHLDSDNLP